MRRAGLGKARSAEHFRHRFFGDGYYMVNFIRRNTQWRGETYDIALGHGAGDDIARRHRDRYLITDFLGRIEETKG
jgi:hypothetical protein